MSALQRPVRITLLSQDFDAEAECFEYEGIWIDKDGKPFLLFEEMLEDGSFVKSTIRIDQDKVAILRHEKIGGHMILDPQHRYKTKYHAPYGTLEFYVTTQDLKTSVMEDQIMIQAQYSLQLILDEKEMHDPNRQDVHRTLEILVKEKAPTGA